MKKKNLIICIIIVTLMIMTTTFYFYKKENDKPIDIPITDISVNSPNDVYTYGETFLLTVNISPTNATDKDIIFKSDNPDLVSIDDKGNIKIIGNEDAEVTITVETKDGKIKKTVKIFVAKIEQIVNVTGIEIESKEVTLQYGETIQINAKVKPENATNKNIIWTTNNPSLVSIDAFGKIKLNSNEEAEVMITAETEEGNFKDTLKLITKKVNKVVKVSKLKLDKEEITLKYGEKTKISAEIKPTNATNKNIIWTSSNPSLVSVDNQGNIEVIDNKSAEVIITAQTEEGNHKSTVKIITKKVDQIVKVISLEFDETKVKMEKGKTLQLNPTIYPNNSTSKIITWKSTNSSIVSVNNSGLLTAKNIGSAKITASIDDVKTSITVSVVDTTKPIYSPTLEIKTKTDDYTITGLSDSHVSKKYYSNDQKITINIKKSEDIEYYAYAIATTQEEAVAKTKTIVSINEPLKLNLKESEAKTFYIWGVDGSKNYSKRFIRLYIKHQKIFLEASDYTCLPIEIKGKNEEARFGSTCYSSLKRTGITYENYTQEQKELITRYFNSKISKYSNDKRKATVAAAQFLAGTFDTKIDYVSNLTKHANAFYLKKGINFNDASQCWNCTKGNIKYGLQCSGYVSWALYNGGYTNVANYGVYPGANILVGYQSPYDYYVKNGDKVLYGNKQAVLENKLIVSNSNIIEVNQNINWSKVKAGDLVGYEGHVGMIIYLDEKYVYIAHNAAWASYGPYFVDGIQITRYEKSKYHNYEKFGKGRIILMDEIYNKK